ncbi:gamma-glutamylcyclotransferase [Halomonas qinghailakensis]|uniref:Gamma-glutamylcyclotransferase n=1 Tax=Halomonas qinghailakensis TaxID=2937790 RepID=A0AA46TQ10_9GAMM|nr:gamma-glutamylcyclotransferase family protein [Halomonas sp. ZZQ-149]UYO74448.1 gamma-glutamylcyclotransferase [Halomonas sp. ZZQ-149]
MKWLKRLAALGILLTVGSAGWLWLTMLSPWFYERPAHLPVIEQRTHHVFVYGTLRYSPVRWVVMGSSGNPQPARLEGFTKEGLDLAPDANSVVEGLRLAVTADQLARLDRYERLGIRYERIKQTLSDGSRVWVYVRLPTLSQLTSPVQQAALIT